MGPLASTALTPALLFSEASGGAGPGFKVNFVLPGFAAAGWVRPAHWAGAAVF